MSHQLVPYDLQDVYIEWTKLTAVKHRNKSAKHMTRTKDPPSVPTRQL